MDKQPKSQPSSEGEERLVIEHIEDPEEDVGIYLKEGEYNVEKILEMRIKNGKKQFFVKWEGYPSSQNTWEPAEHLSNVPSMVKDFEAEYAKKNVKPKPHPKKPDITVSKPKEVQARKHKASPLKEETVVKKTKFNPKGEEEKEDVIKDIVKDAINSPASGASNFEFDFSDEDKPKPEEAKPSTSASKKEVPIKPVVKTDKPDVKSQRMTKVIPKEANQRKLQVTRKKERIGSFKDKDRPKEILGIKPGKNNEFYFLVEWHKRSDGTKPENSHVSNEEFRTHDTNFLLDFYESKIVIFARKQGKGQRITDREKSLQEAREVAAILNLSASKEAESASSQENQKRQEEVGKSKMVVEEKTIPTPVTQMNGDKTLEDIARELDFQALEEADNNFMGLDGDEEF